MARADSVKAHLDLKLVVSQLNREYEVKDDTVAAYVHRVRKDAGLLKYFSMANIPLSKKCQVNALSKLARSLEDKKSKRIQWKTLLERSVEPSEVL